MKNSEFAVAVAGSLAYFLPRYSGGGLRWGSAIGASSAPTPARSRAVAGSAPFPRSTGGGRKKIPASSSAYTIAILLLLILFPGCGSAVSSGHNTALDYQDLQSMTSQMASGIVASPAVESEIAKSGPLRVVCEAVENRMTGEILPRGEAEAYTAQIRALLSEHAPDKFTWVMNRDEFNDMRRRELSNIPLGPSPDAINPQYALVGRFDSLTQEDQEHRSSYYLCTYRLTDLDHRTVLWEGAYKVKKNAVKGFLD